MQAGLKQDITTGKRGSVIVEGGAAARTMELLGPYFLVRLRKVIDRATQLRGSSARLMSGGRFALMAKVIRLSERN